MDKISINGIEMPRTRTLEVGGVVEAKEAPMASGKIVRDIIGYRVELTANWEWLPQETVTALVALYRSGAYVTIRYPDPVNGPTSGKFKIEIGNQKVFKYRSGEPYWYNVNLTATAQEVV